MERRLLCLASVVLLCAATLAPAWAAHSREDAVALVRRAAEFLHSHDRATAFAAFSDPNGAFRDGDLYLYVLDAADPGLTMMAHGSNPSLIGRPQRDMVDADGYDFNARTIVLANTQGEGWINYKWPNPATKKIAQKSSFFVKVGTLIVGAGIYQ
jgi:signal transduction histidine kinase